MKYNHLNKIEHHFQQKYTSIVYKNDAKRKTHGFNPYSTNQTSEVDIFKNFKEPMASDTVYSTIDHSSKPRNSSQARTMNRSSMTQLTNEKVTNYMRRSHMASIGSKNELFNQQIIQNENPQTLYEEVFGKQRPTATAHSKNRLRRSFA